MIDNKIQKSNQKMNKYPLKSSQSGDFGKSHSQEFKKSSNFSGQKFNQSNQPQPQRLLTNQSTQNNNQSFNQRCVIQKLGIKLDSLCQKKGHEKGKVQYVCMEPECRGDKKLACAHCIIDEHQNHVQNKITIKQFCDKFESSFKKFALEVKNLDELQNELKLPHLQKLIVSELGFIQQFIQEFLEELKERIIIQITEHSQISQSNIFSFIQEQKQLFEKANTLVSKNLFDMNSQELETSLLIMDPKTNNSIHQQLEDSKTYLQQYQNNTESHWLSFKSQIDRGLQDFLKSSSNFMMDDCSKSSIPQAQHQRQQSCNDLVEQSRDSIRSELSNQIQMRPVFTNQEDSTLSNYLSFKSSPIRIDSLAKSDKKLKSDYQTSTPVKEKINSHKKQLSQSSQISLHKQDQPYIALSVFESSRSYIKTQPTNIQIVQFQYQLNQSSPTRSFSPFKQDSLHISFPYRLYTNPCVHIPDSSTVCIFKCCNQAFSCQQCHDQLSSHKAQISIPSSRYCMKCLDIFQVNCLSTVNVNCSKCYRL